jgi:hypothetical protein
MSEPLLDRAGRGGSSLRNSPQLSSTDQRTTAEKCFDTPILTGLWPRRPPSRSAGANRPAEHGWSQITTGVQSGVQIERN